MTNATCKPDHMPWVSPYLIVQDVEASIVFYKHVFGFKATDEIVKDDNGDVVHAAMTYNGFILMLGKEGAYGGTSKAPATSKVESPTSLYLYCDDVDAFYKSALKSGAETVFEPNDTFWGDRMCKVQDPNGHQWSFATHTNKNI